MWSIGTRPLGTDGFIQPVGIGAMGLVNEPVEHVVRDGMLTVLKAIVDGLGPDLGSELRRHRFDASWLGQFLPRSQNRTRARICHLPHGVCLLYTSPSPRDRQKSRMPSSA